MGRKFLRIENSRTKREEHFEQIKKDIDEACAGEDLDDSPSFRHLLRAVEGIRMILEADELKSD